MATDTIARVNYFDRQFLRTQDFADEQSYHIAMRRRHNIAQHGWGIVEGLQLVLDEQNLFVQPGMAIDVFGRELVLEDRQPIPVTAFDDSGSEVLNVWLVYDTINSDQAPPGYAGCGNSGGGPYYRVQELAQVRPLPPDPEFPDPRDPGGVLDGDAGFVPSRRPPDDPQRYWPVFLGKVTRQQTNPQRPFAIDLSGRPYIGLVGESVVAPSGRARLEIGSEAAGDENRLALFILDGNPRQQPALKIDKAGATNFAGSATVHGDVKLVAGAIEFGVGAVAAPQPWRIYRNQETRSAIGKETEVNELRIEMAAGAGGNNQVVIGHWSATDNRFTPCLTVDDQCNVTVHGNLIVKGLTEGKVSTAGGLVPGPFSPAAAAFVTSGLLSGLGGAGVSVERTAPSSLAPGVPPLSDMALHSLVAGLHQPDQLTRFVDAVKRASSNLAGNLRRTLGEG
jgi:hypothetical protein